MPDFLMIFPVVVLALFPPIIALARGLRLAGWAYLALIPVFMYQKSMFSIVDIAGQQIQWITLCKDVVALLLLAFAAAYCLLNRNSFRATTTARQRSALAILSFFGAYFVLVAVALGNPFSHTLMGIRPYLFYAVVGIALAAMILRRREDWSTFAQILQLGVAVIAVIALIQNYFDAEFLIHPTFKSIWQGHTFDWRPGENRLRGFFTAANTLGYFMALGIGICTWNLLRPRSRLDSHAAEWVLLPVFLWVLILTLSRSALLGAVCMVGILVLARMRPAYRIPCVFLGAAAVAGVVFLTPFAERFQNLAENPRLVIWYAYVTDTLHSYLHTLVGRGVGSLGRYGVETSIGAIRIDQLSAKIGGGGAIFVVDNFFVRTFYETGLFGFLMLLWVAITWLQHWRVVASDAVPWAARAHHAFASSLMAFIVLISIFSDSFGTFPWNIIFWLALAGSAWGRDSEHEELSICRQR